MIYNCYLHFIKTIHLFSPHSKLIKLNDTIMEINWKWSYCVFRLLRSVRVCVGIGASERAVPLSVRSFLWTVSIQINDYNRYYNCFLLFGMRFCRFNYIEINKFGQLFDKFKLFGMLLSCHLGKLLLKSEKNWTTDKSHAVLVLFNFGSFNASFETLPKRIFSPLKIWVSSECDFHSIFDGKILVFFFFA